MVEHNQVHLFRFHLLCEVRKITDGTGEPVEARHQELIAFAHEVQRLVQGSTIGLRATGPLLLEDFFGSRRFELADLRCEVLARRRHAGISDFHVPNVLWIYATASWDTIWDTVYGECPALQIVFQKL